MVDQALRCWQRVLELDPNNGTARDYLASAGALLTTADLEGDGNSNGAHRRRSESSAAATLRRFLREGRLEEALSILYEAHERNPQDARVSQAIQVLKERMTINYCQKLGALDRVPTPVNGVDRAQHAEIEERIVLQLVDGIVSYDDILEISKLGRFRTSRALVKLLEKGILTSSKAQAVTDGPAARPNEPPPPPEPAYLREPQDEYSLLFERATQAYLQRKFVEARNLFQKCVELRPEDRRARHNWETLRDRGE